MSGFLEWECRGHKPFMQGYGECNFPMFYAGRGQQSCPGELILCLNSYCVLPDAIECRFVAKLLHSFRGNLEKNGRKIFEDDKTQRAFR